MQTREDVDGIIRRETLVSGLSNALFNGLIAWLLLRAGGNLTFAGEHSFAVDIMATAFILPFIVTLIVIPMNAKKRLAGKAPTIELDSRKPLEFFLLRFPNRLWLQALCFGLMAMLVFTPLTLLPLWVFDYREFTPTAYSLFKGGWAGIVAALLTKPMLLLALQEN
ncbi:MAG: hypothetical protein HOC23_19750 [Halieaceae bacterium]|jgi:hypothetical protein|nr:hypothetical protein [Halieaceae bacterium]